MKTDAPIDVLAHEVAAEKASAFGRAGRRLEAALGALPDAAPKDRDSRLWEAADALFAYLVQREALGLRDSRHVIREFKIPAQVLARMGVRPPR